MNSEKGILGRFGFWRRGSNKVGGPCTFRWGSLGQGPKSLGALCPKRPRECLVFLGPGVRRMGRPSKWPGAVRSGPPASSDKGKTPFSGSSGPWGPLGWASSLLPGSVAGVSLGFREAIGGAFPMAPRDPKIGAPARRRGWGLGSSGPGPAVGWAPLLSGGPPGPRGGSRNGDCPHPLHQPPNPCGIPAK